MSSKGTVAAAAADRSDKTNSGRVPGVVREIRLPVSTTLYADHPHHPT
eukprot:SAG31_NODE_28368_length_411_cov_0.820513_2_plen_47_part_01